MRDYEFCTECGAKIDLAEAGYHDCGRWLEYVDELIDEYIEEYRQSEQREEG